MLIENSALNTVTKEWKQTCFLYVGSFSFLWYGEREPGPIVGCNKCVNFIYYVKYAAFRRCLVNEDNQILHEVLTGILWEAAFTGLPRSIVFMFFPEPLGFAWVQGQFRKFDGQKELLGSLLSFIQSSLFQFCMVKFPKGFRQWRKGSGM